MECDRAREAVSARIDGEDCGVPGAALAAHLSGCAACRAWEQRAHVVTRHARLGGAFLDRDLSARVLAAAPAARASRWQRDAPVGGLANRTALVVIALAQLAITVPLLVLGHDPGAGAHASHELGSFDLALAIAFGVGAIRPALSSGLAWPCCIAAGGLTATAVIDLIGGQAFGPDEAQHLIALAGALLLLRQARRARPGSAGTARVASTRQPDARPAARALPGPAGAGEPAQPSGNDADVVSSSGAVVA
jgi:predicted anti-sigma-YlaC factor YlaD